MKIEVERAINPISILGVELEQVSETRLTVGGNRQVESANIDGLHKEIIAATKFDPFVVRLEAVITPENASKLMKALLDWMRAERTDADG